MNIINDFESAHSIEDYIESVPEEISLDQVTEVNDIPEKSFSERIKDNYGDFLRNIVPNPPTQLKQIITAAILATTLSAAYVANSYAYTPSENPLTINSPLVQKFNSVSNPNLADESPSEDVQQIENSQTVEYLDLSNVKDYFLVAADNEDGYRLAEPADMELSETEKLALKYSKNVLPIITPEETITGTRSAGTMFLTSERQIKEGIHEYKGFAAAHVFEDGREYFAKSNLNERVDMGIESKDDSTFVPIALDLPSDYNENPLPDAVDSAQINFISGSKIEFSSANTHLLYQSHLSANPEVLLDQDIFVTGFPRALANEGEATRVIVKGKISEVIWVEGKMANIYLELDPSLDKAFESFGGISGGKASFYLNGKEFTIGSNKGYRKDANDPNKMIMGITPIQDSYVRTEFSNPIIPADMNSEIVMQKDISFDTFKEYVLFESGCDLVQAEYIITSVGINNPTSITYLGNNEFQIIGSDRNGVIRGYAFDLDFDSAIIAIHEIPVS